MTLSIDHLLKNASEILNFDIIFDGNQHNLLSLNGVAADFIDDLNILIQDLLIYSTPNKTILSWDGSINDRQDTTKFAIIINNKAFFDKVKDSKSLYASSYPTKIFKNIQKYNLMIHNKEDFDYINNNQVLFIDRLPEFKRFMTVNEKDFVVMNKKVIQYTLKGEGKDIIKLTSDVEFHISYLKNNMKVCNEILDNLDNKFVYVSEYLYPLLSKSSHLYKDGEVLASFNINNVKALEGLDDFQICINYLNLVDNQLQVIGTDDEEFELVLDDSKSLELTDVKKYEYLVSDINISDINTSPGINFLNLNNNKVHEIHRLCFDYALARGKVILLDIPFLLNTLNDKKLGLNDIVNIYILGRKTALREYNEDENHIYQLLKIFFVEFKKIVPKVNRDITIIFKNCDYLFKSDLFKKEEKINANYYKWQSYFFEFNEYIEEMIISKDFKIQVLIQSEDFDDDTKIPSFFDDLYLTNNKISNLNVKYPDDVNDYRDYLNISKGVPNYVEISKRPLNIGEIEFKDNDNMNKPIYGVSTTMAGINAIFEKTVLYKKLYQAESHQNLNILLYGMPSMGKTLLINQLSFLLTQKYKTIPKDSCFKSYNTLSLISKYIGESEKNIRNIFSQAREHIKNNQCLYFIILDNIDTLLPRRGSDNSNITDKLVNTFLTELDGIDSLISNKNLVVVCVTNRPDKVDPAVLRPGRIENHIKVVYNETDYREVVGSSLKDYDLKGVDVDEVVKMKDSITVGGLLKTFNECKMNGQDLVMGSLDRERDMVSEYTRYFDRCENKTDIEAVDSKESYM